MPTTFAEKNQLNRASLLTRYDPSLNLGVVAPS
jgi:hypothetical protein